MSLMLHSTYLVAIAEIGDKTQFLSLFLAARYPSRCVTLILAVLAATILNHALASFVGVQIAHLLDPVVIHYASAGLFIAIGAWILIPDSDKVALPFQSANVFITVFIAFFLAEMGDKTQLITVTLGTTSPDILAITLGTTMGMMIANIPVILAGKAVLSRISFKHMRVVASVSFVGFGIWQLLWGL